MVLSVKTGTSLNCDKTNRVRFIISERGRIVNWHDYARYAQQSIDELARDCEVQVFRAKGPGGQGVNTTDSAVRITHLPTGIVVTCQNERSQIQNKATAMGILRSKLYELEEHKRADELDELRGPKHEISFGNQIRNYVLYPYQLVKDLRSGVETGNVDAVLDGDIDEFVVGYHRWRVAQS